MLLFRSGAPLAGSAPGALLAPGFGPVKKRKKKAKNKIINEGISIFYKKSLRFSPYLLIISPRNMFRGLAPGSRQRHAIRKLLILLNISCLAHRKIPAPCEKFRF